MCLFASLPPRGLWPLAVVGAWLLAAALRDLSWRGRAAVGAAAGVTWFGPSLVWVAGFTTPGYLLLVCAQAGLLAAIAAAVPQRWPVASAPVVLVLAEVARGRWPLGGFPLGSLAHGQVDGPFAELSRLGGPLLVVAVVGVLGAAATDLRAPAAGTAMLLGITTTVAALVWPSATGAAGPLAVAVVQGGGARGIPAVVADADALLRRHLRAAQTITQPVDLLLLPEGVLDVDAAPFEGTAGGDLVSDLARRLRSDVIAGVVEPAGRSSFRNSAVGWTADGRVAGRYDKVHLVPFGEYVPARDVVTRVADLSLVPRDAIPGDASSVLTLPSGRIGAVISYEVFFPRYARAAVRAGAELIVVPTNASSFTTDTVPADEFAAARMRAMETGRWVLQAAPTGFSAIIDPDGRVARRSVLGRSAVLTDMVQTRTGLTPYARTGDKPLLFVVLAVWVGLVVVDRRPGLPRPPGSPSPIRADLGGRRRPSHARAATPHSRWHLLRHRAARHAVVGRCRCAG